MSSSALQPHVTATAGVGPRLGLIGLLGSGNLGNDGSMEALLTAVRASHPDVRIGCLCDGPDEVATRFGLPTSRLFWNAAAHREPYRHPVLRLLGKAIDTARILAWTRRFDAVVVPGMGVLEDGLRVPPWSMPHALFVTSLAGRLTGTRVALLNVGANVAEQPATRRFFVWAARLAHYRSYRDEFSRDAMRTIGVDEPDHCVYPDLAFSLPQPEGIEPVPGAVGVGVMGYWGENEWDDAQEVHDRYVRELRMFVRWLVDRNRPVRLLVGDRHDEPVVAEILDDLRIHRPELPPGQVVAEPIRTMSDLMHQVSTVETVVASRYHNVLAAVKLGKPTVSIGYGPKNDVLMAEWGLAGFCQSIRELDSARLCAQFTEVEQRRESLVRGMRERNVEVRRQLSVQLDDVLATLLDGDRRRSAPRFPLRAWAHRRWSE